MMETDLRTIELARRVLTGLFERPETVTVEDRRDLLALAQNQLERELPLRVLAVLVLDRAGGGRPQ